MKVVTWQSSRGGVIDICEAHEAKLKGNWPKDSAGEEYCTVSHGAHQGNCAYCTREQMAMEE